jgi:hypothetical protein
MSSSRFVDEFAAARLELTARLRELAERPELLLTRTPAELLDAKVQVYRACLARLTELDRGDSPEATEEGTPGEHGDRPAHSEVSAQVVDVRDAYDSENEHGEGVDTESEEVTSSQRDAASAHASKLLEELTRLHESGDPGDTQHGIMSMLDDGLPELPRDALGSLVHLLVACLRRADDAAFLPEQSRKRTAAMFRTLRDDYTDPQQIYVHGMALAHQPAHGQTWADDAAHHLDAFSSYLSRRRE